MTNSIKRHDRDLRQRTPGLKRLSRVITSLPRQTLRCVRFPTIPPGPPLRRALQGRRQRRKQPGRRRLRRLLDGFRTTPDTALRKEAISEPEVGRAEFATPLQSFVASTRTCPDDDPLDDLF